MRISSNRRKFLGLASGALALPFLPLGSIRAQSGGKPPLRLITILDSYGLPISERSTHWVDSEVGDYELLPSHLGTVLQPLAAYRENMIIPSGIRSESLIQLKGAATHGGVTTHALTGSRIIGARARPGPTATHIHESIDVRIGAYLSEEYGLASNRVYPHVFLSDYAEADKATFCADKNGKQIRAIAGVDNVMNTLFGGATTDASQPSIQARLAVLEQVQARIAGVRPQLVNANASSVMDAYHSSVSALASELELRAGRSCVVPSLDTDGVGTSPALMHDLIYHALACDMASSVTYAIGGEQINNMRHRELADRAQGDSDVLGRMNGVYHGSSHLTTPEAYRCHELVRTWHTELLAGLLDRLKATPDVDGESSMFDNTVVFLVSAMGENVHSVDNLPFLMIAGDNANLRTGYHYECTGRSNNELLTTIAQGLTLPITEFGGFNEGVGPLVGLNNGPIAKMLKAEA